ncbi:neutral/alkaline non-lysosomal ceramidase N-terminal domain-containing protein [candidate division KSB1 bacterium]|nr:neutral/alkaline non-lysosomal ceramidase N-terminal domain-containing protein [candidate division KSB1 bacterium]
MSFKISSRWTALIVIVAIASVAGAVDSTLWRLGTARLEVTPADSLWLAGYAARDHGATGTLHPLWIKAMAMQDRKSLAGVIVTSDLLGFPGGMADSIKSRCAEKYQLDRAQLILSSSHTHSGPVLANSLYDIYDLTQQDVAKIERYSERLREQIVEVIGEALARMQPARLCATNGVVRFQVNRRNNDPATLSAKTELRGPNEHAVPVLQALSPDEELLAILFGYACHPSEAHLWSGCFCDGLCERRHGLYSLRPRASGRRL